MAGMSSASQTIPGRLLALVAVLTVSGTVLVSTNAPGASITDGGVVAVATNPEVQNHDR